MKIAIINTLPIPSGEASVNRLMSYAKGLTELGHKVILLSSGFYKLSYNRRMGRI